MKQPIQPDLISQFAVRQGEQQALIWDGAQISSPVGTH